MKKAIILFIIFLLLFISYLLFNTFNFKSTQLKVEEVKKIKIPDAAVNRFVEAIAIRTVSFPDEADFDSIQFQKFNQFLKDSYPLADSLLEHKTFNEFSHLYFWEGKDSSLPPVILMSHSDVVPIASLRKWTVHPFTEGIQNDTIYGRGTMDDKFGVIGIMEAAELLLKEGFQPKRSIYFAFGHDEEILGERGAETIANYLEKQGVKALFVLDEGQAITERIVSSVDQKIAFIGTAEKGYTSLELRVDMAGGHSSMPENETSIDVLAKAITSLKNKPFPAKLTSAMDGFMDMVGPEMGFTSRLAIANRSIFKPMILGMYESIGPSGNASIRTTVAPTIFESGIKDNVIPTSARAIINFRILPGETKESVFEHVKNAINDDRIQIEFTGIGNDPSPLSPTSGEGFDIVNRSIKEIFPSVLTATSLVIGATDSRYFYKVSPNVYRFIPYHVNPENLACFHGIDERVGVSEFKDGIRFYRQVILNSCH